MLRVQRPSRPAPVLSPATAKQLIESFTAEYAPSSSSDSPDSLYTNGSPTLADQEYDLDPEAELTHEQHDEADYETLISGDVEGQGWGSEWGRWSGAAGGFGSWRRGSDTGPDRGRQSSIISISSRGSISGQGSRKHSLANSKKLLAEERRDSDPSLLGFDLAGQRRRSSVQGFSGGRRRSSAMSSSSMIDAGEEARLRYMNSMSNLGRRFSEVVEVTVPSDDEHDQVAMARTQMSRWSPYTASSYDDDESDIHTAQFFPTPELPDHIPAQLSNFPLSSVAAEQSPAESDVSAPVSPAWVPRRLPLVSHRVAAPFTATPPPPLQPVSLLRDKIRPNFNRNATESEVQSYTRSTGVPPGAAPPRPNLNRSVSAPHVLPKRMDLEENVSREAAALFDKRPIGSFPIHRAVPLGVSPLRESLRRESLFSEGGASRRQSTVDGILSYPDRRVSLFKDLGSARRRSASSRRGSAQSRKASLALSSSSDPRRDSLGSVNSRKNSVVSVSEYGYLAPQIMVTDDIPNIKEEDSPNAQTPMPGGLGSRRNAPSAIVLPAYQFPSGNSPLSTPTTPRYNPMDFFLGRTSPPPSASSVYSFPASSPRSSTSGHTSTLPHAPGSPKSPAVSIMDRGRPISPPEFHEYLITPTRYSPRSSPSSKSNQGVVEGGESSSSSCASSTTGHTSEVAHLRPSVARKAVPAITPEELKAEVRHDEELRRAREGATKDREFSRRGGVQGIASDEAVLKGAAGHRRTISAQVPNLEKRPPNRRQTTMPATLEDADYPQRPMNRRSRISFQLPATIMSASEGSGSPDTQSSGSTSSRDIKPKGSDKRFSLALNHDVSADSPQRAAMHRASSFSRFFHVKSKGNGVAAQGISRPISVDSGSDRHLSGELKDMFKKLAVAE